MITKPSLQMLGEQEIDTQSFVEINLFKKILLFINVSVYRAIAGIGSTIHQRNYRTGSLTVAVIVAAEYFIATHFFPGFMADTGHFNWFLIVFIGFHGIVQLVLMKDIIRMVIRYNNYYGRYLFYISLVVVLLGIAEFLIMFNDSIGHLPK